MADEVDEVEKNRRESTLRHYAGPLVLHNPFTWPLEYQSGGLFFSTYVFAVGVTNAWSKKPWYFAIVPRLALAGVAAALGYGMGCMRVRHYQMRDAIVEHYIRLHPEDFENLSNSQGRKFSEVMLPWYPIRAQESKP